MPNKAYIAALDMLARREYTEKELTLKLEQKGICEQTAREVLNRLKREGMQSDERYAGAYLQTRKKKGFGPNYIRKALQDKGISSEIIDDALSQETWFETALMVWTKKYNAFSSDLKTQSKQKQFLFYRGFEFETIGELFKELSRNSETVDNEKC